VAVRVNSLGIVRHAEDVAAVEGAALAIMLPKAEASRLLTALGKTTAMIARVETADGILDVRLIAATPGVVRLAIGTFDLAAEFGVDPSDWEVLLLGRRSARVMASAAVGLAEPIDGVHAVVDDEGGLRDEAEAARRLGFTGELCVRPRQVGTVVKCIRTFGRGNDPGEAHRRRCGQRWCRDGAVKVDGAMVAKPVIDRARRILERTADS
jgi:citrate lyase subunit beta/citryl-CoA lyase